MPLMPNARASAHVPQRAATEPLLVYLLPNDENWHRPLLRQQNLPNQHVHTLLPEKAHAFFLWVTLRSVTCSRVGYAVGLARGLGVPVFLATDQLGYVLQLEGRLRLPTHRDAPLIFTNREYPDPLTGYVNTMADMDVRLPPKYRMAKSSFPGLCKGCGGSYAKGDTVQRALYHGAYHLDCYSRLETPQSNNSLIFTEELVESLRKDNARLEQELAALKS